MMGLVTKNRANDQKLNGKDRRTARFRYIDARDIECLGAGAAIAGVVK
jgi:hypothetical protein